MSFRARAILGGAARGFLSANNQRRARMEERMKMLADNKALREQEQAKTAYDQNVKAAQEEEDRYQALRSAGDIEIDGTYKQQYFDKLAYAEYRDPNNRAAKGLSFQQFADQFRKLHGNQKFTRKYKSPSELQGDLMKLYDSIDERHKQGLSQPVLTGFDVMLARGAAKTIDTVGEPFGVRAVDPIGEPEPEVSLAQASPLREGTVQPTVETVSDRPEFTDSAVDRKPAHTYKTYDSDGTEHVVFAWDDGSVTTEATGLNKPDKANTVELGLGLGDLKDPVDPKISERIRDGVEATRLVGEILTDTSVETSASIPKAVASIITSIEEEITGTFGSAEEKRLATNRALNAAFGDELAFIDSRSEEDLKIGTTQRNKLMSKVAGLKQNKRALAYALVRLNRASGRFNGQELQEQLDLLTSGTMAEAASVLRRAQQQVQSSLNKDMQNAAASVITTQLAAQGEKRFTKNEVLGWVSREPVRDPKNGAYYIMFRTGPYKYAYMSANGGVTLRKREE